MPIGINNATAVNITNITDIINFTEPHQFMTNVNNIIYAGYLFFIILWIIWIILFVAAEQREKQPLINAMLSGAVVSVLALLCRVLEWVTDKQLFVFPIITICLAAIVWATKEK